MIAGAHLNATTLKRLFEIIVEGWVKRCGVGGICHYLKPAVFFAMPLGCATNCFPAFFPTRFAFVVAAYSAGLNALIAFSGRYRSPVFDDGFPLLVRHF
jgi:hypothetical protein